MGSNNEILIIPVELCKFALSKRKTKEVSLWIFLKSITSGHFLLSEGLVNDCLEKIGWKTIKTFNKHFFWLINHKWISVNSKRESYRLISFSQLSKKLSFKSTTGAIYKKDYISTITGFFSGAVISYCVKRNMRRKGRSVLRKHGTRKRRPYPYITNYQLLTFLNIPKSTAQRYKKIAIKTGYVQAFPKLEKLIYSGNNYQFFRNHGAEAVKSFRYKDGHIYEQLPDEIYSNIVLHKRQQKKMGPFNKA